MGNTLRVFVGGSAPNAGHIFLKDSQSQLLLYSALFTTGYYGNHGV